MSSSSHPPLHIFISHSQTDNDFGIKLFNDLNQALGERGTVWYDAHGLYGGDTWWPKIAGAVKASNVFLVILSPQAVASKWVNDEINLAWLQRNKAGMLIIPLHYRKCSIPDFLNLVQIISFLSPKPYNESFNELLNALGLASPTIIQPPKPHPPPLPARVVTASLERASHISRERIIQTAAILVILLCLVFSGFLVSKGVGAYRAASASRLAMATTIATHYPFSSHEVLHDPLTSAHNQQARWRWDTNNCSFWNQGYVSNELQIGYFNSCFAIDTNFVNFTYEVTMTITEGDCGDLLFRANAASSTYYLFSLCQNGYYYSGVYGGKYGNSGESLINYSPSGFDIGLNYAVSLAVVSLGNSISYYVDGILIGHVFNDVYTHGQIGVAADSYANPTQVIFTNAQVWT